MADHKVVNLPVLFGKNVVKTLVFKYRLDHTDPQTVGDRRVNHQRLFGNAPPFGFAERIKREHIVQPITQLDHQHAHIIYGGDQHFAEGQCRLDQLFVLAIRGEQIFLADMVDLGQPVNELRHIVAKLVLNLLVGTHSILDRVMQNARDHHRLIAAKVRNRSGGKQRMNNIRLAAFARLPRVGKLGTAASAL